MSKYSARTLAAMTPALQTREARDAHVARIIAMRDAYRTDPSVIEARYWFGDRHTFEEELSAFVERTWDAWQEGGIA